MDQNKQTNIEIKQLITDTLKKAVFSIFAQTPEVEALFHKNIIDRPADIQKGDYTTSVALTGSKLFAKSSVESAIAITAVVNQSLPDIILKVEVAGPGFINFYLKNSVIENQLRTAVADKKYGALQINVGKKIAYEYTDPNPFKVFHIGHLMANTVGESLSRLGEYTGAEIKRFCYQGDLGRHVALFVYGLRLMDKPFPTREEGEAMPLVERMYYMGTSYAKGATYFKEHKDTEEGLEQDVQNINRKLYERSDEEINQIYDLGLEWSLQYFETLYDLLGTKFDRYFFESTCVKPAELLIFNSITKKDGIFTESDGAIVFEGEKFQDADVDGKKGEKLHTRVFFTKFGLPTYDAKELGLAKLKYEAYPYDKGIVVTANEQDQYFKVNLKAQSLVLPELAGKNTHISHGMMVLPSGKMSSRTGDVLSAEEMIESAKKYTLEIMKDREMNDLEKENIAKQIAIAGIKYLILRQASGKDVIYDAKKALSFEGDSGPYLQYTTVRARSIISKATAAGIVAADFSFDQLKINDDGLKSANALARKVYVFPEIVERAYTDNAPHIVATYLIEIAGMFNAFYANNKIVDNTSTDTSALSAQLLSLTTAVEQVLANGLYLLGIAVPERM